MTAEHNYYRDSVETHKSLAETYADDTKSDGSGHIGNPCSGASTTITNGAWESPEADRWVEELNGLGNGIKDAFESHFTHATEEYNGEPEEVEVPGDQDWKFYWLTGGASPALGAAVGFAAPY